MSVHKTPFWENLEILASTASIFTQILAHKPQNLEIFSSQAPKFGNFQLTSPQIWKFSAHKPPFSEINISSQAPHFGNLCCTPLPEKKLSALPPGSFVVSCQTWCFYFIFAIVVCFIWIRCFSVWRIFRSYGSDNSTCYNQNMFWKCTFISERKHQKVLISLQVCIFYQFCWMAKTEAEFSAVFVEKSWWCHPAYIEITYAHSENLERPLFCGKTRTILLSESRNT